MSSQNSDMITKEVLNLSDLPVGSMKEVEIEVAPEKKGKVLIYRTEATDGSDGIYATSSACTHYGLKLANGIFDPKSKRITCFAHGACFNICTGDIEDAPGLDALYKYEAKLSEDGQKIIVSAPASQLLSKVGRSPLVDCANKPRTKRSQKTSVSQASEKSKDETTVIVGGGPAGLNTVESLREHGYEGKIVLISKENHAPIDRTKLSKALVTDVEKLLFRKEDELKNDFGVELHLGTSVTSVDTSARIVKTDKDQEVKYDNLVLVTGGIPRKIPVDGADLKGVFTLREIKDAQDIVANIKEDETKVAIIGTSFIGMEVAGAIAGKKPKSVDVIGMDKVPFTAILGDDIGQALRKKLESQDIKFHMEASVKSIKASSSDPSRVGAVVTEQGEVECDILIMGTGVRPATDAFKSITELNKDGSLTVNEHMEVKGLQNVYAAGDIATYPSRAGEENEMRRVEHWSLAGDQGRVIGQNIATPAEKKPYTRAPLFWSSVGGGLRYVGTSSSKPDDIHIDGNLNPDELSFVAYYGLKGKPFAVASIKKDPYVAKASELFRLGQMPSMEELKKGANILEIPFKDKIGN